LKGKPGPAASLLRPVLDTYMDAAVALVGCTSRGLDRYSCEYDLLVVSKEKRPPSSLKIGDVCVDLTFVSENDVLKPLKPEHSFSVALAKPVRDTTLILSTGIAANLAVVSESAKKASGARLASSLKILGRAEEAIGKGALVDADFWLMAASYEFAYAWLLSKEVLPSPSHLLSQLRKAARGSPRGFEGFSIGAGLEAAGRAGCGARLEGVSVLHDIMRERPESGTASTAWPAARTEILASKANELVTRVELAECYSFLGQELIDALLALLKTSSKRNLGSLASGKDALLGERILRQLGMARTEKSVRAGLDVLKEQVSSLARKP
jgi:hypothetical protein